MSFLIFVKIVEVDPVVFTVLRKESKNLGCTESEIHERF